MKFSMNNYKGAYAMHCKTEEEARNFRDYLHAMGKTWSSGCSYARNAFWQEEASGTAYAFNEGKRGGLDYFVKNGYEILEWSDFEDGAEVEDMTLEEVCEALGKKIRIVEKHD